MVSALANWVSERAAGILLHPACLPGDGGIGTLGTESFEFLEFLNSAELSYWEMLPVAPVGYGDSPYASPAELAGNPMLIDLQALVSYGLLDYADLRALESVTSAWIDHEPLARIKRPLLRLAFRRFQEKRMAYLPNYGLFSEFVEQHASWLKPATEFLAVREHFGQRAWYDWPGMSGKDSAEFFEKKCEELEDQIRFEQFCQYLFEGQWNQLRERAREEGIQLVVSLPFYPAVDSVDVFRNQALFELSDPVAESPQPAFRDVGGADDGSSDPAFYTWSGAVFDWNAMKAANHAWWLERLECLTRRFDVVRLLNVDALTRCGSTLDGKTSGYAESRVPADELLDALVRRFPDLKLIADTSGGESLRTLSLRQKWNLPATSILTNGFDGFGNHSSLPHFLRPDDVVYVSEGLRQTAFEWYEEAGFPAQDHVRRYLRVNGEDIAWDLIRCAMRSAAGLVIIPMQDLMGLNGHARMVFPKTPEKNWRWRMTSDELEWQRGSAGYMNDLAWLFDR